VRGRSGRGPVTGFGPLCPLQILTGLLKGATMGQRGVSDLRLAQLFNLFITNLSEPLASRHVN
jgi:hypothetical protein